MLGRVWLGCCPASLQVTFVGCLPAHTSPAYWLCAGRVEANSPARAAQLRRSLEKLGPAYVKVAQALSTRVDLLSPPYLAEIERLQDQVQPFPDAEAVAMISAGESP